MANRTVSVALELQAQQYKAEADAIIAKTMEMDREVEALDKDIKDLGPDAAKAAAGVALLGEEHGKLGTQADQAKTKIESIDGAIKKADEEIARSKTLLSELAAEFGRTGDLDVVRKFTGEQSNLSRLEKMRTDLEGIKTDAEDAAKAAENAGKNIVARLADAGIQGAKSLVDKLTQSLSSFALKPTGLTQWLVAGAVAASPIIGAALGAAVTLGIGGGTLAAGIVAAGHDPRVSAAWSTVISDAGKQFQQESGVLAQPLENAANIVGAAFGRVIPQIGADLATLAPRIDSLAHGASGMLDNIFKGGNFDRIVALSGRLLDKLSSELPNFGNAFSNMLGSIAAGGPGIEQFWSDFLTGTEKTVVGIGNVTEALSKTYEFLGGPNSIGARINNWADEAGNGLGNFAKWINDNIGGRLNDQFDKAWHIDRGGDKKKEADNLTSSTNALQAAQEQAAAAAQAHENRLQSLGLGAQVDATDFATLSKQINAAAMTTDTLAGQMTDKILSATLGLDRATLGVAQAQTQLADTFAQTGKAIDRHTGLVATNTKAGEALRSSVLNVVQANQAEYDAMVKAGAGADQAAAAYDQNTAALEAQLRKAGLTQQAIDNLIGKYRNVPKNVDTNIAVNGLTDAINNLDETLRLINGLPPRKTVNVDIITSHIDAGNYVSPSGHNRAQAFGGIVAAAQGMIATNAPTVVFGERTLPEAYIPAPNSNISQSRADSLLGTAAAWWDRDVVPRGMWRSVAGGAGGRSEVTHRVVIQEPSGRRIAELVIEDSRNGGTAFNAYVRQVANR